MKEKMFHELLESVQQAGAIMRGEMEPGRRFVVEKPDVKSIRSKLGATQSDFATMLGISVRTLENWEQRRRTPRGPARVLLQIAADHPEIVWDVVKQKREKQIGC
jgi:putative transcriptional regulator